MSRMRAARFAALGAAAALAVGPFTALAPRPAAQASAPRTIHLTGTQSLTITADSMVTAPILVVDDAILTIRGATVRVIHPADDPRANIYLGDRARLVLEDAALIPEIGHPDNLYLTADEESRVEMRNSAFINVVGMIGRSTLTGDRARITSSLHPIDIPETAGAFGIVQVSDHAHVTLTDSTVGSIGFFVGPDDEVSVSDLKPRTYADFDLARDADVWTPPYNVVLRNTRVQPVRLRGPFERSWAIFVDPGAKLTVTDSSLNKLVLQELVGETLTFRDLPIDRAATFDFRDIHLVDTSVANEWGLFGRDSNITVERSQGVWLWPRGTGDWVLRDSQMIEFDPRAFTGTLTFVHGEWANAGEIFERSDLTLKGSFRVTQQLDRHLVVADSTVRREYLVRAVDAKGRLVTDFRVTLRRGSEVVRATSKAGVARPTIAFSAGDYRKPLTLTVTAKGVSASRTITLFSDTPIVVRLPK